MREYEGKRKGSVEQEVVRVIRMGWVSMIEGGWGYW